MQNVPKIRYTDAETPSQVSMSLEELCSNQKATERTTSQTTYAEEKTQEERDAVVQWMVDDKTDSLKQLTWRR